MSRQIWKFPLVLATGQTVSIPSGANIVHVHEQGGVPCVWAEVYPTAPQNGVIFNVVGTGQDLPPLVGVHIGTCHIGPFVWHVYVLPHPGVHLVDITKSAKGDSP